MLLAERTGVYRESINALCRKMQIFVVLITGGIYTYIYVCIYVYHSHINGY
jgi:hypothetical protein